MCDNHPEFVTHWLRALPAKFQFSEQAGSYPLAFLNKLLRSLHFPESML